MIIVCLPGYKLQRPDFVKFLVLLSFTKGNIKLCTETLDKNFLKVCHSLVEMDLLGSERQAVNSCCECGLITTIWCCLKHETAHWFYSSTFRRSLLSKIAPQNHSKTYSVSCFSTPWCYTFFLF